MVPTPKSMLPFASCLKSHKVIEIKESAIDIVAAMSFRQHTNHPLLTIPHPEGPVSNKHNARNAHTDSTEVRWFIFPEWNPLCCTFKCPMCWSLFDYHKHCYFTLCTLQQQRLLNSCFHMCSP